MCFDCALEESASYFVTSVLCDFSCVTFLYLGWYVMGDDALISKGSFMQTKHVCVLIHITIKGVVGTVKHV